MQHIQPGVQPPGPNQVTMKVKDLLPATFIGPRQRGMGSVTIQDLFYSQIKTSYFSWREDITVKSCLYLGRQIISNPLGDKSFLSFSPLVR